MKINREAEMAVVGSMMVNADIVEDCLNKIDESHFYSNDIKTIFVACKKIFLAGNNLDIISVSSEPSVNRVLLSDILSSVVSSSHYLTYVDIVIENSKKNKLLDFMEVERNKIHDESSRVDKILSEIERYSVEMSENNTELETTSLETSSDVVMKDIEDRFNNPKETTGIPTGFKQLDKKLNGLNKGDLIILAARPACGKSTFAMQVAKHVAIRENTPTMLFSLEMTSEQITERVLCSESKVPMNNIKTGKLSQVELDSLKNAHNKIKKSELFFNDKSDLKVADIRSQIRIHNARNENKIGLVIVDYLQLMAVDKKKDNLAQQISEISRGLKLLALEFKIPVICLSQLSRDVEKRGGKPKLSDLRDSGAIEQDADIVMFLHRERKNDGDSLNPDVTSVELLVEKHRNGELANLLFSFTGNKMMFAEDEFNSLTGFTPDKFKGGFSSNDFS